MSLRLLNKLDEDVSYIKQRSASSEPGMINTATKKKPGPEIADETEDQATLFDDMQSVMARTEQGQGPAYGSG